MTPQPERITAAAVRAGDVIVLNDRQVTVTCAYGDTYYEADGKRTEGIRIEWRAGTALGVTGRRGADLLHRIQPRETKRPEHQG